MEKRHPYLEYMQRIKFLGEKDRPPAALDHLPLSQATLMDKLGAAARLVQ